VSAKQDGATQATGKMETCSVSVSRETKARLRKALIAPMMATTVPHGGLCDDLAIFDRLLDQVVPLPLIDD
jgi:hypothetical protein